MTTPALLRIICVSSVTPLAVPVFAPSQADFNRRIAGAMNSLARQMGVGTIGDIKYIAGSTLPPSWLFCDASAVSRISFPDLFVAIGVKWGAGDGVTTFNLPPAGDVAISATPPATTITGGSVTVVGSVPTSGAVGGTGGNTTTGGRAPSDTNTVGPV